jgi:phospholipase C
MCWLPQADAYTDTSLHPASMIQPGENLLAAVYNTLRNSPCWNDTLLVINFDENGGIYDHVFPPTTTPPDPEAPPATQSTVGCCGNNWTLNSTFDFSLLGFRVPALLISPWLSRGIDNTQYQNTSVLRFIIDTMNANYGTSAAYLTSRDASAPSLDSVFSQFGQSTMRTDCPGWITPYPTLPCTDPATGSDAIPYNEGNLTAWTPPAGTDAAPPVDYINELMNIYVSPLPGHPDSGKMVTRTFPTNAEVMEYIKERMEAAGH